MNYRRIQPSNDRVLIQRIENPTSIVLTDEAKSTLGVVLAVGPGKWHEGEWWYHDGKSYNRFHDFRDEGYYWIPGYRDPMQVKPGMTVLFNSCWNDLRAAEHVGTGCDGAGPLERPLAIGADEMIHLVTEADIFGIVPGPDVKVTLNPSRLVADYCRDMTIHA